MHLEGLLTSSKPPTTSSAKWLAMWVPHGGSCIREQPQRHHRGASPHCPRHRPHRPSGQISGPKSPLCLSPCTLTRAPTTSSAKWARVTTCSRSGGVSCIRVQPRHHHCRRCPQSPRLQHHHLQSLHSNRPRHHCRRCLQSLRLCPHRLLGPCLSVAVRLSVCTSATMFTAVPGFAKHAATCQIAQYKGAAAGGCSQRALPAAVVGASPLTYQCRHPHCPQHHHLPLLCHRQSRQQKAQSHHRRPCPPHRRPRDRNHQQAMLLLLCCTQAEACRTTVSRSLHKHVRSLPRRPACQPRL